MPSTDILHCGCEVGEDCRRVTVCHVQLIVDEYNNLIDSLEEWLSIYKPKLPADAVDDFRSILKQRP